jgi:ATP/maltotriose-dependent transcriptional regulator MalT/DNA-binding SARP family transcriptional activator
MEVRRRTVPPSRVVRLPQLDALVARPRLEHRLDEVLSRRLALVIGGAGYGKSTLVAAWSAAPDRPTTAWCLLDGAARELRVLVERTVAAIEPWLDTSLATIAEQATTDDAADAVARADGVAAWLAEELAAVLIEPFVLVVDDLHELAGSEAAVRFVEGLVRGAPPHLHLVLTSRDLIPFPVERLRGQGQVVEIRPDQLLFDAAETSAFLEGLGADAAEHAAAVHELTGGWPALTRLVLESLRGVAPTERAAVLARIRGPEGPLLAYIAEEVLSREPAATLEVIRLASRFERVDPDLIIALGLADAGAVLDDLARQAFFVEARMDDRGRTFVLHGLVRDYALDRLPIAAEELADVRRRAARWLDAHDRAPEALDQRRLAGDHDAVVMTLDGHGLDLIRHGGLDAVVQAARSLPVTRRTAAIELVLGDALLRRGEWDEAMDALRRAAAGNDRLPAAIAWRLGFIQHERGDVRDALATFERVDADTGDRGDLALVAAWRTIAHWQLEQPDDARRWADRARLIAEGSDDDRVQAAVQAALGAVAHMDGRSQAAVDAFGAAIRYAQRAADLLLEVRFRSDLGYNLAFQGRYTEALAELDQAVARGAALGNSTILGLSLSDRSQAHVGLGRLQEALADVAAARALYERLGSAWVAYPMVKEANVHRLLGTTALARSGYQAVIANADPLVAPWFLAEAILGLAATTVDEDVPAALHLVDDAMGRASAVTAASTPLLAAEVCLAAGRVDLAGEYARRARTGAEARVDRSSLAGALEILAVIEPDGDRARSLLEQAAAIWQRTGSPLGLARHDLVRAEVIGGVVGQAAARQAAAAFRRMGARALVDRAVAVAERLEVADRPPVEIRALGAFQVLRAGTPVPVGAWGSKKARDLLKMLVTRRGRPTTREQLCELLWPDEDPGPLSNRLSVVLNAIRSALDPERCYDAGQFIVADKTMVALDLDHLAVDVEVFLDLAGRAMALQAAAGTPAALADLVAAETAYRGDLLEGDALEDWSAPLHDELRASYLAIARLIAEQARADGDADTAVPLYLRILEHDPFDESAHLHLVAVLAGVGRHGEARRRYQVYTARMAELAIEAAPYPAVGVAAVS